MADNTTATLDKLACTDYVDFGKHPDRFGQISWLKISFHYLDVKLKLLKKDVNKEFRLLQQRITKLDNGREIENLISLYD